jgi:hypothetical protein
MTIKEIVCSYKSLSKALNHCNSNVMWKDSVIGYNKNRCQNLYALSNSLMNDTYEIDRYITFQVREPKVRDIVATRLKDRVFQRSLCDNYLTKEVTRHFIYDNCACQRGKGTDFARQRFKVHLQKFYRKHGANGYVLSLDIKNFFGSTNHEIAKKQIGKLIRDDWARERVFEIIDSFSGKEGIGLGSQISQLIELSMLNDLDHSIKEAWRIEHYIRYMDDIKVIHQSKEYLVQLLLFISKELNKLGLAINKDKTFIAKLSQNTKFLGFSYHYTKTGKIIMTANRDNVKRAKRRIKKQLNNPRMTLAKVKQCLQCYIAHIKKGNNFNLINRIYQYFERRLGYVT